MARIFAAFLAVLLAALPRFHPAQAADGGATGHEILDAIVGLRMTVPMQARSARTLGIARTGTGVVISGDGLILTAGYLIMEADTAEVLIGAADDPIAVPARPIAYDPDSGFGLLRAAKPLGVAPLRLGTSNDVVAGAPGLVVSFGGEPRLTPVRIVDRRPFAGGWEFVTGNALFTMPAHGDFGGAALIDPHGALLGIGSLLVNDALERDRPMLGNMFLPIDSLKPVLAQLVAAGRRDKGSNPWLGLNPAELGGRVVVARVQANGPAEAAGLQAGDVVVGVGGRRVITMIEYFERVWAHGPPGTPVVLDVLRAGSADLTVERVTVRSQDRADWLLAFGGGAKD